MVFAPDAASVGWQTKSLTKGDKHQTRKQLQNNNTIENKKNGQSTVSTQSSLSQKSKYRGDINATLKKRKLKGAGGLPESDSSTNNNINNNNNSLNNLDETSSNSDTSSLHEPSSPSSSKLLESNNSNNYDTDQQKLYYGPLPPPQYFDSTTHSLPLGVSIVTSYENEGWESVIVTFNHQDQHENKNELMLLATQHQDSFLNQYIVITGCAKISVLKGSIRILGYTLTATINTIDQSFIINSPSWMSSLCIEPLNTLSKLDDPKQIAEQPSLEPPHNDIDVTVVKLISMSKSKQSFLLSKFDWNKRHLCFSNRWDSVATSIIRSIQNINSSPVDSHVKVMQQQQPEQHVSSCEYPSKNINRILICGAKGVGKSTYLRYLVNRILSSLELHNRTKSSSLSSKYKNRGFSSRVAVLDCDVGQPEFTPPGILSLNIISYPLLDAPHMIYERQGNTKHYSEQLCSSYRSNVNISSYYYGSVSSKNNPVSYMNAIQNLIQDYERIFVNDSQMQQDIPPLIINTDGWVKGMGYEMLSSIIDSIRPGQIVQILGQTKAKFFDLTQHASESCVIHVVDSFGRSHHYASEDATFIPNISNTSNHDTERSNDNNASPFSTPCISRVNSLSSIPITTPTMLDSIQSSTNNLQNVSITSLAIRTIRLCMYFLKLQSSTLFETDYPIIQPNGIIDDDNMIGSTLAAMPPYCVPYSAIQYIVLHDRICSNWGMLQSHQVDHILDSLNGSLVGLCTNKNPPLHTSDHCLPCLGLGIVRGIDRSCKILYILTPLSPQQLKECVITTLVVGGMQVPLEFLYRGVDSESCPYLCYDGISIGIGHDVMKSKNAMVKK